MSTTCACTNNTWGGSFLSPSEEVSDLMVPLPPLIAERVRAVSACDWVEIESECLATSLGFPLHDLWPSGNQECLLSVPDTLE